METQSNSKTYFYLTVALVTLLVLHTLVVGWVRHNALEEGIRIGQGIQAQSCVDTVLHYAETNKKLAASF